MVGEFRLERLEYVQVHGQRAPPVQIPFVFPTPAKRLAIGNLQTVEVDGALVKEVLIFLREIGAHDRDHVDRREEASRYRGIAGRAAEQIVMFLDGRLDTIERNRTCDEKTHFTLPNFCLNAAAASVQSAVFRIAETTAIRVAPASRTWLTLSRVIPPMAKNGIFTFDATSRTNSTPTGLVPGLVAVGKTGPTPM